MEDRHQQHAAPRHVVEPHEQGAGKEQRDELNGEDHGSRYQRRDSPAFLGEVVGEMPHRPQERDVQGEFHGVIPVLPMVLKKPGESDLFGKLEEHQLEQKVGGHLG